MKKIVAGNWKMNTTLSEGKELTAQILNEYNSSPDLSVILCPPFTHLAIIADMVKEKEGIHVAAQDCSAHEKGAYTGEVSSQMIRGCGADYVIIGHSERRTYHEEDSGILNKKLGQVFNQGMTPILCCGESLKERESGKHFETIEKQLRETLFTFDKLPGDIIIAYEPVWAIGTGKTASREQAGEMHAFIHKLLSSHPDTVAKDIPMLYGGSCNPQNAEELFNTEYINGGLIGGASLKANDFLSLISIAKSSS